jgi:hypothetical protein
MNKYLECAGVAVITDLITGAINFFLEKERNSEYFINGFLGGLFFTSIPAAVANVIDSYVNPHITDNKYLQYGLTALESGLGTLGPSCVVDIIEYFKGDDANMTKAFVKGLFS